MDGSLSDLLSVRPSVCPYTQTKIILLGQSSSGTYLSCNWVLSIRWRSRNRIHFHPKRSHHHFDTAPAPLLASNPSFLCVCVCVCVFKRFRLSLSWLGLFYISAVSTSWQIYVKRTCFAKIPLPARMTIAVKCVELIVARAPILTRGWRTFICDWHARVQFRKWHYECVSIFLHIFVRFIVGKNRIEDSRFFQILKKRAFPFFRPDVLGKLRRSGPQMGLRTKLTGPGH